MSSSNSRKRAAPGAATAVPVPQQVQQPYGNGDAADDQMMMWNGGGDVGGYIDGSGQAGSAYDLVPAQPYSQGVPTPSNTLTRRPMNGALIPTNPRTNFDSTEPWAAFGDDNSLIPQTSTEEAVEQDNVELLEERAQKAKRDAHGKRKQIPPFVQKLSSFLEEQKNTDLIRWSEKGDSFVVLDEDEFAKTLIPELFKHNNYASFVRQLNMYGFHKRVGLSDNSMRASERKNKSPSEYSNPYFRRGHPNLLWLINKPKSGGKTKKGGKNAEADGDSDDEVVQEDAPPQGLGTSNAQTGRALPPPEAQPLPKKEMTVIREELNNLREQQKLILGAINRLQRNNNDLYNQALMFQTQHDRHQNSINAILNFLANVFRKTLEDQGNSQSVSDIISSMISNPGQQSAQAGSVFDLGDFFQGQVDPSTSLGGPPKRPRGLLPPIPGQSSTPQSAASASNTPYHPMGNQNPEMGHVTELVDGSPSETTTPNLRQELETNPQERMMKIINDHNATNSSGMNLPGAAELVANTPNTLNQDQRSKLVNFMAGQSSSGSPTQNAAGTSPSANLPTRSASSAGQAPAADSTAAPSLSPIMRSPAMTPPSLHQISTNQIDLNELQRLQNQQDTKISELSDMLGPLSPSGRIPGLDETGDNYFDPSQVDLDQYFDSNAFLNDGNFGSDVNDFDFTLDNGGDNAADAGQAKKEGETSGTPSPSGTEEIQRDDLDDGATAERGTKRRRVD